MGLSVFLMLSKRFTLFVQCVKIPIGKVLIELHQQLEKLEFITLARQHPWLSLWERQGGCAAKFQCAGLSAVP